MATPANDFQHLKSWLDQVQGTKTAGTLPEKPDDGTPATEGALGAENSADAKKVVPGSGVETGANNPEVGKSDKPVPNSGLLQTTVGKMPEVEKAVKTVKDEMDKAANADLSTDAGMDVAIEAIRKAAAELPTVFASAGIRIDPVTAQAVNTVPAAKAASPVDTSKQAQDIQVASVVDQYRKLGADRGTLVANYLDGFYGTYQELAKMAADGSMGAMLAADPAAAAGPGGPPPGPPPGGDPAGGAMPPPEAGGPPPGAGGPGGDGAPSLDDVAAALTEMGLTPDQLMEIAQKMQGDVEGTPAAGAPQAGPDAPPPEEKAAALTALKTYQKVAADTKQHMRDGKFAMKPAGDGTADRRRRDVAKHYFRELLQASK